MTMDHDTEPAPVSTGPVRERRQRDSLADAWRETKSRVIVSAGAALVAALTLVGSLLMSRAAQNDAATAVERGNAVKVVASTTDVELDASYKRVRAQAEETATINLTQAAELRDLRERLAALEQRQPPGRRAKQSTLVPTTAVQEPLPATPAAAAAQEAAAAP
jgi:hypothetical protein